MLCPRGEMVNTTDLKSSAILLQNHRNSRFSTVTALAVSALWVLCAVFVVGKSSQSNVLTVQ